MMLHLNEKLLFFYCPIDDNADAIQMLHVVYRHTKNISVVYNICLSRRVDKEGTIKGAGDATWFVQPGKKETEGRPHHCLQVFMVEVEGPTNLSSLTHDRTRRNCMKLSGEV